MVDLVYVFGRSVATKKRDIKNKEIFIYLPKKKINGIRLTEFDLINVISFLLMSKPLFFSAFWQTRNCQCS
jgi:hypothetical protein